MGPDAAAAIERLGAARLELGTVREIEAEIQGRRLELGAQAAALEEREAQLGTRQEVADEMGQRANGALRTALRSEVVDVEGLQKDLPEVGAARVIDAARLEIPEDAPNETEQAFRTLLDGLRAGHDPTRVKLDGMDLVRVGTTDGDLPIVVLASELAQSERRLRELLTQRERDIFETHLLARVGDGLRQLLFDADEFEQRINRELAKAPTSSAMTVQIRWEPTSEEPSVRDAVKLLRHTPGTLGPQQRDALRSFFSDRIAEIRSADQGQSYVEVLTEALDYRQWHRFALMVRFGDSARRPVTRTFFRGLSGGEAATVLHLPLFAAAAAHYSSGSVNGPRMIALDEAFAGIDDQTRGRLMGLLVQLDLDVLLTSHEFWGLYGEVPALVGYDLNRRPPTPGCSPNGSTGRATPHRERHLARR
ncbi:MAG: hypothetical protein ACI8Y4_002265 [Candidatus Poriferisodalaceae bacterium]